MRIGGYLKTSLLDWPTQVASVIWTVGCNFRCPFCHNRSLVLAENGLEMVEAKMVLADLKKRKKWVDGLVITGGEPTLQPDLVDFCRQVKKIGLGVKLDTNGTNPAVLMRLIGEKLVDFVAVDVKSDRDTYERVAGVKVDINKIGETVRLLVDWGGEYELRTTVVPEFHNEVVLTKMAEEIAVWGGGKWVWQNFRGGDCLDVEYNPKRGYRPREIKKMRDGLGKVGRKITLRGFAS